MNKPSKSGRIRGSSIAGAVIMAALGGAMSFATAANLEPPELSVDRSPLKRETQLATSFAPVVERVAPSVVNVYTSKRVPMEVHPLLRDPSFRRFFGIPDDGGESRRRPSSRLEQSLGSGVIVSKDGFILTNNHVVDQADEIKVVLADGGKEFDAKLVGKDPQTDIAVLKVEAEDLPAVTISDSDLLKVGDVVLAIGNPFGVGQTVTMGIVGATGRGGFGIVRYEDYIQTDASINPGNSGGALIDADGRLVGINTFILSRTGGNQGIGFAVPINMARNVMELLISEGKVSRGYIGVQLEPEITPELAKAFNLKERRGAIITDVREATPGEKAGLKPGDVIIEFDGHKIQDSRHLQLMAAQTPPNTAVELTIIREGKEQKIDLTLATFPTSQLAGADSSEDPETGDALWGVEVMDITPQLRSQYDIPTGVEGALVTDVDPESPSYEAGLRPGQVILEIDRNTVSDADDAVRLGRNAADETVLLRVWSSGGTRYVVVNAGNRER